MSEFARLIQGLRTLRPAHYWAMADNLESEDRVPPDVLDKLESLLRDKEA